jgi:SAM-dependent methyltransferase
MDDFPSVSTSAVLSPPLPDYLRETYGWAYLVPRALFWLDHDIVVSAILWGNAARLVEWAVTRFAPGERVLQAACVYGALLPRLARRLGRHGRMEVVDVAPIQIENAARKLATVPRAERPVVELRVGDLTTGVGGTGKYDGVCCFFLLHEVPPLERAAIVANLLHAVRPGGRAVFVDYHRPRRWHPLAPLMALVFRWFEPWAASLADTPIETLSAAGHDFAWRKKTCFGGLYQQVVAERR